MKKLLDKIKKSRLLTLISALLLVGFIVAGSIILYLNLTKTSPCTELLPQAAAAIDLEDTDELQKLVARVNAIAGFNRDSSCLAVVTTYHIKTGDSVEARRALESLKKVYDSDTGYDNYMDGTVKTPEQLEAEIKFMEQQDHHIFKVEGTKVKP